MKYLLGIMLLVVVGLLFACSGLVERAVIGMIAHPQTPQSRAYNVQSIEFTNPRDGVRLAGEVTYSGHRKEYTAIVLISGYSAGQPPYTRNSVITGHQYFLVISDLLTKMGYLVLRFDNRGTGKSSGEHKSAVDDDFASDAAAALAWLRTRSGLTIKSAGYLGHSQGAMKAVIAAKIEYPDFIIFLAGGFTTLAETLVQQNRDINRSNSISEKVTARQTRELGDLVKILVTSNSRAVAVTRMREYAQSAGLKSERAIKRIVSIFGSVWMYTEINRDPLPPIRAYKGPIFALFGTKDLLVSALINAQIARNVLVHKQSEVHVFNGLNHLFQATIKGGPEEYWKIKNTIDTRVISKIDQWLQLVVQQQE